VSRLGALRPDGRRLSTLLAASTVGVYVLILAGVTTAVTAASGACPGWPACGRPLLASMEPALAVALGHRLAALVVGVLIAATAVVVWRRHAERRVRLAVGIALALYPAEVWVGGLTVGGASTPLATLHLVVAMAIFSGLLAALTWQLEVEGPTAAETDDATDPEPTVGPDREPVESPEPDAPTVGRPIDRPVDRAVDRALAYVRLTKPKLWWLLCLVALAAMTLAAGGFPPLRTTAATLAGGVLAIGASGTFNNVLERDRDRRMSRTDDRPIVTGAIPAHRAAAFGVVLAAASVAVFLAFVNALAAGLGLLAVLFYSVVYTLVLKPRTDWNVVLGGAVGAFPALIGWAAVTGAVGLPAVLLGALVFLWTPAHFYNLALVYEADYARAGFPMLPVVRGEVTTMRHVLGYLGATMLGAAGLAATTGLDWTYASVALVGAAGFLWAVVRLHRERSERAAFRTFVASNVYLGALLLAVVFDAVVA